MKKLLLSFIGIAISGSMLCNAVEINGIEYELKGDEAIVRPLERFNQDGQRLTYGGDVQIPEKVGYESKTYTVTVIGEQAFLNCEFLKSVTLPNSIKILEDYAFCGSTIFEITLPEGLTTLGEACLRGTFIEKIHIPESVVEFGKNIFLECGLLKELNIPKNWTVIPYGFLNQCTSLTEFVVPDNIITLETYSFFGCENLKSIKLPDTLEKIEVGAFEKCSSLESIELPLSLKTLEGGVFQYCTSLKSLVIPNSVTKLGQGMFAGSTSLESVVVPESIGKIFPGALCISCPALKYVNIPSTITAIYPSAFEDCPSLETIDIPESVSGIYSHAFYGCKSLKSIYCRNSNPPVITYNTFGNAKYPEHAYIYEDATLYVPSGSVEAYRKHPEWCAFKNIVGKDFSGIEDVIADNEDLVSISGRNLTIKSDIAKVLVYSIDGNLIYNGNPEGKTIELPCRGFYIIRIGEKAIKTFVR